MNRRYKVYYINEVFILRIYRSIRNRKLTSKDEKEVEKLDDNINLKIREELEKRNIE